MYNNQQQQQQPSPYNNYNNANNYNNYNQPQSPNMGMPGMPPPPPMGMPNPYDDGHATAMGPTSCYAKCPSCQKSGYTRADRGLNSNGWIICFILCLLTGICCWMVMLCESNYEVRHCCSNCGYRIGSYQP